MSYADLERLLKQAMGLDAASIGAVAVERAVQARMSACAATNLEAYGQRVRSSPDEKQALIEAIVVPETWFFRDREAFVALARMACKEWLPAHPQGMLRLLSLPCSSGEEPYSMAMALLDAEFPAERFTIDASDISARALVRARRAQYGKNSFRGADLRFRNRHFEATNQRYRLNKRVRQQVQFHRANLLATELPARTQPVYDVIFCRNLLIYFDSETQNRAVKVLKRLLSEDGMLFIGPSESGLLLDHGFVSAKVPLAFAFRTPGRSAPALKVVPTPWSQPASIRARVSQVIAFNSKPAQQRTRSADAPGQVEQSIDAARALADQGRLAEARQCCEDHLRLHGPSPQAYHLMGLIHAAAGNLPEADQYYRRALYLDPNHYDTLLHLAFLLEQSGAITAAQVLRARISRLEVKIGKADESQRR